MPCGRAVEEHAAVLIDQTGHDRPPVEAMLGLARRHPRYGYRRIHAMLEAEGFRAGRDRVHRLWRLHGLRVPRRRIGRRRLGSGEHGIVHHRAEHHDQVWTCDFVSDQTTGGRRLKILTVEDEFTRECLALEVGRTFTGRNVVGVLRELFLIRGRPRHIRSDNGPEFIARAVRGLRRRVPSPRPRWVIQRDMIRKTTAKGHFVVAAGGGGIPVCKTAEGDYGGSRR